MAHYTAKKLPPLPKQASLSAPDTDHPIVPRPLVLPTQLARNQENVNELRRQVAQLQEQNAALCQSLREEDNENIALRQQIFAYKQYIKKQDNGLAEVVKTICSAFQGYRETVVGATWQATTAEETVQQKVGMAGSPSPPQF